MDTVSKALRGSDDQPSRTALHTPTPWLLSGTTVYALYPTGEYNFNDGKATPQMVNRFSLQVQHMQGWSKSVSYGCSLEEAEANAEFIVTAVNSHADLVEALRPFARLLEAIDGHRGVPQTGELMVWERTYGSYSITVEDLRNASAALLKATGSKASECGEQT